MKEKNTPLKFYVALQGNLQPKEYIKLGQFIEELGFDRIYVYDDLLYHPAWPILNLIAEHTKNIELGPCLVNGFYSHPTVLAKNIVFLDEISNGRSVLGVGRGAFFNFLDLPYSEHRTRKGCIETIRIIKKLLAKDPTPFNGEFFSANENAVLQWDPIRKEIPIVLGSWHEKMAEVAGQYCDELQTAENWDIAYLQKLENYLSFGKKNRDQPTLPFSIGGMTCVANNERLAIDKMKPLLAVYFPYLQKVLKTNGIDLESDEAKNIIHYAKNHDYHRAVSYMNDEIVRLSCLIGTPNQVVNKLSNILKAVNVHAILFGPPFGTADSIEKNLQTLMEDVVSSIRMVSEREVLHSHI